MSAELFVGLMSGTSVDAVDAALVSFSADTAQLVATHDEAFPRELRAELQQLIARPDSTSLDQIGNLGSRLTRVYANAVANLLQSAGTSPTQVQAIGCHGQTVRHQPDTDPAFTLQLGNGGELAALTGITSVTDFRSADMALGGQGAPLAPGFHAWAFGSDGPTAIVNIGGISNITLLTPGEPVSGYDVGPGNTLLDSWCLEHTGQSYDLDGAWARTGRIDAQLLERLIADPYFSRTAPKSTGREHFHRDWLQARLTTGEAITPADVQATLTELTAATIAAAIAAGQADTVWICGGGAANSLLVERLAALCGSTPIASTAELGIPPDWVEAVAFAWLARERLAGRAAACPAVTGARAAAVLGGVHLPPKA